MPLSVIAWYQAWPPWLPIGAEIATAELMERLVKRGHRVVAIIPVAERTEVNGVQIIPHEEVCADPGLRKQLGREADVAICPNFGPDEPNPFLNAALTLGCPVGVTLHHGGTEPAPEADFSIANSDWVQALHGCDVRVHPPVDPHRWRAEGDDHRLVTLVGTSIQKGWLTLLAVARELTEAPFLAIRNWYASQRADESDDLPPNLVIEGPYQMHRMPTVYGMSRVLLVPSQSESYGRVCVEGMLNGCHIIAADLPGIREACGDVATYLDPVDHPSWVQAIREKLELPPINRASAERAAWLEERTNREVDEFVEFLSSVRRSG